MKRYKITQEYVLNELLGNGSYGNVYKATHKITKVIRAVKMIDKKKKTV
jgi:serine/threonine protein kinase